MTRIAHLAALIAIVASATAVAAINVPAAPTAGQTNIATADLLVARPTTTPCTVTLLTQQEFADYNNHSFSYAPPASCPGPWSKVVFEGNFSVTAGVQYDRTAAFYIGNVNVYYGTTSEPTSSLSPSWHIERDVTDYSALLSTSQSGFANIGNTVNSTYTGIIYGSADLVFYPANSSNPAPTVPDKVLPLNGAGSTGLSTSTSLLTQTFTLPTNVENAYLDVIAQSQNADEFWYTCVPDDVATELDSCGGTGYREVEVSIDGQPAGAAPVYPWIFTGGLSPGLWLPTPGVQTLNFIPYRVDLTPFAALLSNGQSHTVALSVFNADNYFSTTATLLLVLDHGSTQVTGALTTNTLAAPVPVVKENLKAGNNGGVVGTVGVTSERSYTITGYVNTSAGLVTTELDGLLNFSNTQQFNTVGEYSQNITLTSTDSVTKKVTNASGTTQTTTLSYSYPLTVGYMPTDITVRQQYMATVSQPLANGTTFTSSVSNLVNPTYSTSAINSSQHYVYSDSLGDCYDRTINSSLNRVTTVSTTCQKSATASAPEN